MANWRPDPSSATPAQPSANSQVPERWWIYRGTGQPLHDIGLADLLPEPPPWRRFQGGPFMPEPPEDAAELTRRLGKQTTDRARRAPMAELDLVNAAICLRRPLLVTGRPGSGKSSLAYLISRELRLGRVLRWPVTSTTSLKDGLYSYDAMGRAQALASARTAAVASPVVGIGDYLQLGPLATALLPHRLPRVLLVDEMDKGDLDLPNDLLNVFEEGEFTIPELVRVRSTEPTVTIRTDDHDRTAAITGGRVICNAFPIVVITSNGEREFPPAFLRRCLQLRIPDPDAEALAAMVHAHFDGVDEEQVGSLIHDFLERSTARGGLAADQLLNSVYLATSGAYSPDEAWHRLVEALWQRLAGGDEP